MKKNSSGFGILILGLIVIFIILGYILSFIFCSSIIKNSQPDQNNSSYTLTDDLVELDKEKYLQSQNSSKPSINPAGEVIRELEILELGNDSEFSD